MVAALDVTGERYGRLVAIKRTTYPGKRTPWLMACDCGKEVVVTLDSARCGYTKSCGCLRVETTRNRSITHGHALNYKQSRTLKSYTHAKSRCYNPNDAKYYQYGARGIKMCQEWLDSFETFVRDMGECPPRLSLDRVDVNGHYEPRNCRLFAAAQQHYATCSDLK